MSRDWRQDGGNVDGSFDHDEEIPTPGKRTLTQSVGAGRNRASGTPGKRSATSGMAVARSGHGPTPARMPAAVSQALTSEEGSPLPQADSWSQRLGSDVGDARVVTGPAAASAADSIDARAFTVGNRVFFSGGADPSTDGGNLLAHELTHVSQQRGAQAPSSWSDVPFVAHDDAREHAARRYDAGIGMFSGTGMAVAMDRKGDPDSVNAQEFLKELGNFTLTIRGMFEDFKVVARAPWGDYLAGSPSFWRVLDEELFQENTKSKVPDFILPESVKDIVDRARARDWDQPSKDAPAVQTDLGPKGAQQTPALIEIGNALIRHYNDSIARIFPRVVQAFAPKNFVLPTPENPVKFNRIPDDDVAISHPMDRVTRRALLENQLVMQSVLIAPVYAQKISLHAEAKEAPPVAGPVTIEVVPQGRLWHWVQATPPEATGEQVATVLFGRPEEAFRLIKQAPLWGFRARDIAKIADGPYGKLEAKVTAQRDQPDPKAKPPSDIIGAVAGLFAPGDPDAVDPIAELAGANDRNWAVSRYASIAPKPGAAAGAPGAPAAKHDEGNIIDDENAILKNLTDLDKLLPLVRQPATAAHAARSRAQARLDEAKNVCLKDPEPVYLLVNKQRELIAKIAIGLSEVSGKLVQHGGPNATESVRAPVGEVADAYVEALAALELPDVAQPRIDQAVALQRNLDIALQEAALHERLGELEGEIAANWVKPEPGVDPWAHRDGVEANLRKLAEARVTMPNEPVATKMKVDAQKPEVDKLGFEIGISEKLLRLNMLWQLMDNEQDLWESGLDRAIGQKLKKQNRGLYESFKKDVYDPFEKAKAANDEAGQIAAQKAYRDLLTGPQMKEHVDTVRDFLQTVAKHKKWTKLIVSLVIAFVAFGLGQWEYGAVLAAEGSVFEAAMAAGVVTTGTSVVLNKIILDQNPTVVGVLTSFAFNAGTFFVVGKLALAAEAAGAEAAMVEGAEGAKAIAETAGSDAASVGAQAASTGSKVRAAAVKTGEYAAGLLKEAVIAEVMSFAQAEIEKLASEHRTLNQEEAEEVFIQALVAVAAMRVFHAVTPSDLFKYQSPEQKLAGDITWLKTEQKALAARAKEVGDAARANPRGKPDKAAVQEVLDRWTAYLKREQSARERLLEYAKKNPGKFSKSDIAKIQGGTPDPVLVRQLRETQAMLAIEIDGVNRYSCAPGQLDVVIAQHKSVGHEVIKLETDAQTGQRTVTIKTDDKAPPIEITEKVPPKGQRTAAKVNPDVERHFEDWLNKRAATADGQKALLELASRDPEAAINLAAEKYGYTRGTKTDGGAPVVTPDAPADPHAKAGSAPAKPAEPAVPPEQKALAVKLGHAVAALGNNRFQAAASELHGMHETIAANKAAKASNLTYDPDTNTTHFEAEIDGAKVRVEATLGPKVHAFEGLAGAKNGVVGGAVSEATGMEILRGVANGKPEVIKATGITGEVKPLGDGIEIGLGKLANGEYVIVAGEFHGVDWSALPGIEPAGHSHPLSTKNDLAPDAAGKRQASMAGLLDGSPAGATNRSLIFPSAEDFVTMFQRKFVGHKVSTGFVVDGQMVRKPNPGETTQGLEFTIGEVKQIGTDAAGRRVYESTIKADADGRPAISERKVWIVEDKGSGQISMTEPPGVIKPGATPPATPTGPASAAPAVTHSPAMEKLIAHYGGDATVAEWAKTVPDAALPKLASLKPPARDMVRSISGPDAADLIVGAGGEAALESALSHGPSGPIDAAQLVKLRQSSTPEAFLDKIESAKGSKGKLTQLARSIDATPDAAARLGGSEAVKGSFFVDANAQIAIENLVRGSDLNKKPIAQFSDLAISHQNAIRALRAARDLPPYVDVPGPMRPTVLDIVGPGADMRTTVGPGAEIVAGEKLAAERGVTPTVEKSPLLPDSGTGPRVNGVIVDRAHPDYAAVLAELKANNVGEAKGAMDREFVADTIFAAKQSGQSVPIVSADEGITVTMAKSYKGGSIKPRDFAPTSGTKEGIQLRNRFPEGRFTVTVLGKYEVTVIFGEKLPGPPVPP